MLISYPSLGDRVFTRSNSKLIIAACWLIPPLLICPSLFEVWGRHGMDCRSGSCTILEDVDERSPKAMLLFCGLTVPCMVLAVTNSMIYDKVRFR